MNTFLIYLLVFVCYLISVRLIGKPIGVRSLHIIDIHYWRYGLFPDRKKPSLLVSFILFPYSCYKQFMDMDDLFINVFSDEDAHDCYILLTAYFWPFRIAWNSLMFFYVGFLYLLSCIVLLSGKIFDRIPSSCIEAFHQMLKSIAGMEEKNGRLATHD